MLKKEWDTLPQHEPTWDLGMLDIGLAGANPHGVQNPPGESASERSSRRSGPRRTTSARCRINDGDIERFTRLMDVGAGGIRVRTAKPPDIGAEVGVRFSLRDDGQEVQATGRVVWRGEGFHGRGGVMGVVFTTVENVGEITHYLDRD
ncbi:MAG: PilZ domain-containing protein [Myxococcota bacterium]